MSWATVVRGEGDASALPTQQTSDGRSSVILASGTVDLLLEASKSRSSVRGK